VWLLKGKIFFKEEFFKDAIDCLNKALELEPTSIHIDKQG